MLYLGLMKNRGSMVRLFSIFDYKKGFLYKIFAYNNNIDLKNEEGTKL